MGGSITDGDYKNSSGDKSRKYDFTTDEYDLMILQLLNMIVLLILSCFVILYPRIAAVLKFTSFEAFFSHAMLIPC